MEYDQNVEMIHCMPFSGFQKLSQMHCKPFSKKHSWKKDNNNYCCPFSKDVIFLHVM